MKLATPGVDGFTLGGLAKSRLLSRRESAWRLSTAFAIAVGATVLFGWAADIEWIGGLFGTVRMKANAALAFVLLGLALGSLAPSRIRRTRATFGSACAGLAALIGLMTMTEWAFGWDLRIDGLMFTENPGAVGTSEPGRMAFLTALSFLVGGLAICLLRARNPVHSQALSLLLGFVAIWALATFFYDVDALRGTARTTQMAPSTAATFLVLCFGLLSRRTGGLMSEVSGEGTGSAAARILLPAAVVVPLATGWVVLAGEKAGFFGGERTHILLAVLDVALFSTIVWIAARLLNRLGADAERQRAHFSAVVRSASDVIITRSPDGSITSWNAAAEDLFGYTAAEVMGRRDLFLAHAELEDEIGAEWEASKNGARPAEFETVRVAKDGRRIPVSVSRFQIRDASDVGLGTGILVRDISERQRAEAERERLEVQLRQSQKMEAIGQLAAGVAHDFNNKLAVILGFTGIAMARLDARDETAADLEEIRTAALRSADLTRQLLAFARMQPIAPRQLNLNETVPSSLNMLAQLTGDDVSLAWNSSSLPCWVRIDPGQVDQVLVNLVINARDAIRVSGVITITTGNAQFDLDYCANHADAVPGAYVVLEVADDGCGMDPQTQTRAFEPFFTTKPVGQGTGLGLATVHGIAHQNGGFVEIESDLGVGTRVRVYLPRESEEPDSVAGIEHKPAREGSETVLLVEDEPALLKLTTRVLQQIGLTVLPCASPGDALSVARDHVGKIDLLMTDVVMPGMNGVELNRQIQALRPQLRCLYVSGYPANVLSDAGLVDEGVELLQKPYAPEALGRKVRQLLD